MELYEFVKCKSFFDHVSELIDDDSNGQISLQEWLSFFNEDGEWYCTITQCCTALKHVNISHYIFLCNFKTYVSSRFVVYSSLLLSSPPPPPPSLSPFRLLSHSNQWSWLEFHFFIGLYINLRYTTFKKKCTPSTQKTSKSEKEISVCFVLGLLASPQQNLSSVVYILFLCHSEIIQILHLVVLFMQLYYHVFCLFTQFLNYSTPSNSNPTIDQSCNSKLFIFHYQLITFLVKQFL